MRLLKNIGFVLLAVAVLAIWGRYRGRAPHEGAPSGVPVFATEAKASPFGFVPLPQPFIAPPDRLLILAPADCPKEAGQRADDLVQQLIADGFTCSRCASAGISSSRVPTEDEVVELNAIMHGAMPIVFVSGRVKNNPEPADVESEYWSNLGQ